MTDTTETESPTPEDRHRAANRLTNDPDAVYCCSWCCRYIGPRSKVEHYDKYDRVCCSQECGLKLFSHWSRDRVPGIGVTARSPFDLRQAWPV